MAKEIVSPAYLWYPKDVFSSGRIDELSAAEECWYRRALDRSWMDNGVPADAVKCAAHIGKKCTVKAAEKILAMFFVPMKKDASKMVNLRQEKERTLFNKKRKQKSEAGRRGMAKRWKANDLHNTVINGVIADDTNSEKKSQLFDEKKQENFEVKNGLPVNTSKQTGKAYNSVITENNIPIPISIPISNIDFKRLINACTREHAGVPEGIVELGVLYTFLQRNGSQEAINSLGYFTPQIKRTIAESSALGKAALTALLERRREQFFKTDAYRNPEERGKI